MNVWPTDNRTAEERQKSLRESLIRQGYSPAQADALIAQLGGSQPMTTGNHQIVFLVLAVLALILWAMLRGGEDDEE